MKKTHILLCFGALFSASCFGQNTLNQAKDNLNSLQDDYFTTTSTTKNTGSTTQNYSLLQGLIVRPIVWIATKTVFGEAKHRFIAPYPYYKNQFGEYAATTYVGEKRHDLLQISGAFITGKSPVKGIQATVSYRFFDLLGASFSHTHFYEQSLHNTARLDLSTLLFDYYRIREKHLTASWSLGATYVGNNVEKIGFCYSLSADIFPVKPISFSLLWQQSFVNLKTINSLKIHVNYHLKQYALFTGYTKYALAGVNNPSFVFGLKYKY